MKARAALLALTLAALACPALTAPAQGDPPRRGEGNVVAGAPLTGEFVSGTEVALADGTILVLNGNGSTHATAYDPVSHTFTALPSMRVERVFAAAVVLSDGRVAVFGGQRIDGATPCGSAYAGELYDPATRAWTTIPDLPGIESASAVQLGDGTVLIAALGCNNHEQDVIWNPTTYSVTDVTDTATVGGFGGAVAYAAPPPITLPDGRAVIARGERPLELAAYDPTSASWTTLASIPPAGVCNYQCDIALTDAQHLLVTLPGESYLVDITDQSATATNVPAGLGDEQFANLPDGSVLAAGGGRFAIFDPSTGSWRLGAESFPGGQVARAVPTPSGATWLTMGTGRRVGPGVVIDYELGTEQTAALPEAPTGVQQTPCCAFGVTIEWTPVLFGHDGGGIVTSYVVTRSGAAGPATWTTTDVDFVDSSVTSGGLNTYTVQAVNAAGTGPAATITPQEGDYPSDVTNAGATGDGQVELTWAPPHNDGGSPITAYQLTKNGDVDFATVPATTTTFVDSDVAINSGYDYTIAAVNGLGLVGDATRVDVSVSRAGNHAPTALVSTRSVPSGQPSGLALTGSDTDGDPLSYHVVNSPQHGTITGSPPDLTYTPASDYTGPDSLVYQVDDGFGGSATATITITVTGDGTDSVTAEPAPGEPVSTGAAPTAGEPTQAAVTTPAGGPVTITYSPSGSGPSGYTLVGSQYVISAPQASTAAPLTLAFTVDLGSLPAGSDASSVTIFRDGTAIDDCADSSGTATPDPCISGRTVNGALVTLTVLSSHASQWALGTANRTSATTLSAPANAVYGQPILLTATVHVTGAAPSGVVRFEDESANPVDVLGTARVAPDGTARLPVVLPPGNYDVAAVHPGSATEAASTSSPSSVVVSQGHVTITPDGKSVDFGAGNPVYTYSVRGMAPSDSLVTNPTCGVSVTHTAVGTYPITCSGAVTPSAYTLDESATGVLTVTLAVTPTLPGGFVSAAYKGSFATKGNTGTVTYAITSGSLPPGLKIATTGAITGTPTTAGRSAFSVTAKDTAKPPHTRTIAVSITIAPMTITTATLPTGLVGKAYSAKLLASGGKPTLTWTVTSGALPPGLKLATTGAISGTPTTAGIASFTVQAVDKSVPAHVATHAESITIAPMTITTASLPAGTVKKAYSARLTYSGGTGTHTWSVVGGALPPGVKLATTGAFSGTPTLAGTYSFTVKVVDAFKPTPRSATAALTITIH